MCFVRWAGEKRVFHFTFFSPPTVWLALLLTAVNYCYSDITACNELYTQFLEYSQPWGGGPNSQEPFGCRCDYHSWHVLACLIFVVSAFLEKSKVVVSSRKERAKWSMLKQIHIIVHRRPNTLCAKPCTPLHLVTVSFPCRVPPRPNDEVHTKNHSCPQPVSLRHRPIRFQECRDEGQLVEVIWREVEKQVKFGTHLSQVERWKWHLR